MLGAYGFSPELWKPNLLFRLGWGLKCLEDPTHPYFSHETQIFEHQIGWSFMKIRWCEVTCSVSRVLRVKCWPSWSCVLMVVCSALFSLKFSSLLVVCLSYVSKYAACFNGFQLYIWCLDIFGRLPLIRFHPTVPTASSQAASQKLLGLQCLSQVSMIQRDPAKANRNR